MFKNLDEMIERGQLRRAEEREATMETKTQTRTYRALREGARCIVNVFDGIKMTPLAPRRDLRDHSPDLFQWGYGGSGPSQLALAICADALGDDATALRVYQQFKNAHIALQQGDAWEISADQVRAMCARLTQGS